MKLFGINFDQLAEQKIANIKYTQAATSFVEHQKSNLQVIEALLRGDVNRSGVDFRTPSFIEQFRYYRTCAPLFTAIDMISEEASNITPVLIDSTTGIPEVEKDHEALDFLISPNSLQSRTQEMLFNSYLSFCLLTGNVFMEATGPENQPPIELKIVSPERVDGLLDERDGLPEQYTVQSVAGGRSTTYMRSELSKNGIRFFNQNRDKELWHTRKFNTDQGDIFGMSPLEPLFIDIEQWLNASNHNWSLLKNGARISGVFVAPPAVAGQIGLTPDQFEKMSTDLEAFYTGTNNAGRPAILQGGLEWREMGMSNKDMDFSALKKNVTEQIYTTLKVPLPLISPDHQNFSNYTFANIAFFKNAVLPKYRLMLSEIGAMILPRFKGTENMKLGVIEADIPALEKIKFDAAMVLKTIGVNTIDEIRTKLGYEGVDGIGDSILMPAGMIPVADDQFTDDELSTPTSTGRKGHDLKALGNDMRASGLSLNNVVELLGYQHRAPSEETRQYQRSDSTAQVMLDKCANLLNGTS